MAPNDSTVLAEIPDSALKEVKDTDKALTETTASLKSLQVSEPPVKEISRDHWKAHYITEIDRIINMNYDMEKLTDVRHTDINEIKRKLETSLRRKFGNNEIRLDIFGSSENGFGSKQSDLDICFRFNNYQDLDRANKERKKEVIDEIENALRSYYPDIYSILSAKVPIVKFTARLYSGGNINADISYNNELALYNTRLLKKYCTWTKDDVLSKLGMFVKRWAKQCDICDASKGSLSSYTYIILLIHFLQRLEPHPLLPVLQEMGKKKMIRVDGCDVYFCDDEPKPDWSQCTLSVGELFLQFLDYYAKFEWNRQVVQIRQTKVLTKSKRGWNNKMCIEDPFDLCRNLALGVNKNMFKFIKSAFEKSRVVFYSLEDRNYFFNYVKNAPNLHVADSHIPQYGNLLLDKCFNGYAPCARYCYKCRKPGHFTNTCPMKRYDQPSRPTTTLTLGHFVPNNYAGNHRNYGNK